MAPDPDFAALLRGHRHAANLTLEALGERSGVSPRAISDMERGRSRGPQARTVEALADTLGLRGTARVAFTTAAGRGRSRPGAAGVRGVLPAVDETFVGRAAERRALAEALLAARGARPVVVSGPGGIGKSTLAVRSARDVVDRFGGGLDFVALGGGSERPVPPATVAAQVLLAHGTEERDLPHTAEERFAALADLLSDRRGLLILDDAHDEAQLRPLLRHRGGTAVLVTSRRALGGLDAAARFPLTPLSGADARQLLTEVLGDPRAGSHRGLGELADVCGRFPLALRIVANRLLSRPGWTVQTMLDRLADESVRLGRLRAGDVEVETAFAMSYAQLRPTEQVVFRRMGLVDGPSWSTESAAVLAELPDHTVDGVLDDLVELGMLVALPDGRYAFHDLLRLFALDRAARDDGPVAVDLARSRHHTWLLVTAADAGRWFEPARPDTVTPPVRPVVGDRDTARRWLQAESANWFAALQAAADGGADHTVLDVADAMHWYSDTVPFWPRWFDVFDLARRAAHRLGDDALEATHTNYLAWVEDVGRGNPRAALDLARQAAELAGRAGDVVQLAWAETYAAGAHDRLGQGELVLPAAERALAAFERAGDPVGALQARTGTARALLLVGRPDDAVDRAAEVLADLDARAATLPPTMVAHTRATVLSIAGQAHAAAGRVTEAEADFETAIRTWADGGMEPQQARAAVSLARLLADSGEPTKAADVATRALGIARAHGDRAMTAAAEAVLATLAPPP